MDELTIELIEKIEEQVTEMPETMSTNNSSIKLKLQEMLERAKKNQMNKKNSNAFDWLYKFKQ